MISLDCEKNAKKSVGYSAIKNGTVYFLPNFVFAIFIIISYDCFIWRQLTHCMVEDLNLLKGNISSRFCRNSEAFTSEFLENLEKVYSLLIVVSG